MATNTINQIKVDGTTYDIENTEVVKDNGTLNVGYTNDYTKLKVNLQGTPVIEGNANALSIKKSRIDVGAPEYNNESGTPTAEEVHIGATSMITIGTYAFSQIRLGTAFIVYNNYKNESGTDEGSLISINTHKLQVGSRNIQLGTSGSDRITNIGGDYININSDSETNIYSHNIYIGTSVKYSEIYQFGHYNDGTTTSVLIGGNRIAIDSTSNSSNVQIGPKATPNNSDTYHIDEVEVNARKLNFGTILSLQDMNGWNKVEISQYVLFNVKASGIVIGAKGNSLTSTQINAADFSLNNWSTTSPKTYLSFSPSNDLSIANCANIRFGTGYISITPDVSNGRLTFNFGGHLVDLNWDGTITTR